MSDRGGHLGAGIAMACYGAVAIVWIVPDRRIDREIRRHPTPEGRIIPG
jgi:hypothetical protein